MDTPAQGTASHVEQNLKQLSELDQTGFTRQLADIFEHSPWVAERAWVHRPFQSLEALHQCMVDVVKQASRAEQHDLIMAHPELAGKEARSDGLTPSSTQEQHGAGLDQCSPDELQRLRTLNTRYRQTFGFPFIIAVKGLDRYQIMDAIGVRLSHTPDTEFQTCLNEIAKIARFRLHARLSALTLEIEALSRDAFAPFGDLIHTSTAARQLTINEGNTERYHDLAQLAPGPDGRIIVSLFRAQPRRLPFVVTMMERHPLASQAFIPMSDRPWLVIVAPPGEPPRASDLRLFLCQGDQGVNYAPGVWHHPILALNEISDFLVLDREGPGDNCDVIQLHEPAIIPAIDLPSSPAGYRSAGYSQ